MSTTIEQLIENRQLSHLTTLDAAYIDAYTNLRRQTGEDVRLPHLLADSYTNYNLWRKSLITAKLDQVELNKRNTSTYPTNNRFLLPQCGNLQSTVQQSMVISMHPSVVPQSLSYPAWRRLLLARKFEKRRGLVEEESIRRRAAEAVQRAMEAEAAAREEYEEIKEERERHAPSFQLGNETGRQGSKSATEQEIWRIKHRLSAYDEINDPAVMQAILALGIGASNKHNTNSINGRKRANSSVARSLFGDAVDRFGARSVTALSFLPENPDIFAAATDVGIVYLCSAQHGLIWATLTGHEGSVTAVDWAASEGNIFLVTTSVDKTARVWYITLPVIEVPVLPTEPSSDTTGNSSSSATITPTTTITKSSTVSSLRSRSTSKVRAKDPLIREAEREKAKKQMEKEREKLRLEEWKARGPVAHGGTAQVVQVIVTDCPLTAVSFFPLNPSLFVAAAIEESDYNSLMEAQAAAAAATSNPSATYTDSSLPGSTTDGANVTGNESTYKGYGPDETDNAAAQQMKQVGKALENVFKKGFDVALKGVAKTAQAVVQVGSILPGVALLAKRRARARGYILVMDAVNGEVIQRRLIQGDQVNPTTLQRPISYPTALTFSLDGTELYVADGRGLVHQYDVETDDQKISNNIASPLGNHTVLYGESSALISGLKKLGGHMKAAIVEGGTGLMDNNSLANIGLPTTNSGTTNGGSNDTTDPNANSEETPIVYFTSLYFKRDFALDAPVLVGLDSTNRVRALSVPNTSGPLGLGQLSQLAAPDDDVAKAALAAVGATTKATAFLLKTTVGVATLGAVQMNTQPQSTELANYIQYSQYYNTPIGAGDVVNSLSHGSSSNGNHNHSSSNAGSIILPTGGIAATNQAHIMLAPVYSDDTILTGNASGDIYVLHPHGTGTDTSIKKRGRSGSYLNLALGSTSGHHHTSNNSSSASIGSGVSAVQVESKLSGHTKPLSALAIAPRERYLASADINGNIIVWEKISVNQLMQEYETKKQKEAEEEEHRRRISNRGRKTDARSSANRNRSAPPK